MKRFADEFEFYLFARTPFPKSFIEERSERIRVAHALLQRWSIVGVAPRSAHIVRARVIGFRDRAPRRACAKQLHAFFAANCVVKRRAVSFRAACVKRW
jgi:hypothetical protein